MHDALGIDLSLANLKSLSLCISSLGTCVHYVMWWAFWYGVASRAVSCSISRGCLQQMDSRRSEWNIIRQQWVLFRVCVHAHLYHPTIQVSEGIRTGECSTLGNGWVTRWGSFSPPALQCPTVWHRPTDTQRDVSGVSLDKVRAHGEEACWKPHPVQDTLRRGEHQIG